MKITKSVPILSTVWMAKPLLAGAWSFGVPHKHSGLTLLNEVPIMFDTPLTRMLREHDKMIDRALSNPMMSPMQQLQNENFVDSPRFEIINNDREIKIAIDVPGVNQDDIDVKYDNDSKMLSISGSRESKGDGYSFSSKFSRSFTVDPTVNIDKFTAQLENGVLIVTAPKDIIKIEEKVRKIPILAHKTTDEEAKESTTNFAVEVNGPIHETKESHAMSP